MKVTLNWLKQYVQFDWSPEELAERLTMLGLEVEGVSDPGAELAAFSVGYVRAAKQHPNADRLRLCTVETKHGVFEVAPALHVADPLTKCAPAGFVPAIAQFACETVVLHVAPRQQTPPPPSDTPSRTVIA